MSAGPNKASPSDRTTQKLSPSSFNPQLGALPAYHQTSGQPPLPHLQPVVSFDGQAHPYYYQQPGQSLATDSSQVGPFSYM